MESLEKAQAAAQQGLQTARDVYDLALSPYKLALSYFGKSHNLAELLSSISAQVEGQVEAVTKMSQAIKGKTEGLSGEVSAHYAYYRDIMLQLQTVLFQLIRKSIPAALHHNIPESVKNPTQTLYDWIPAESIDAMKQEALDEMTELQKMRLHVNQLQKNTLYKSQHIVMLATQLNDYLKDFNSKKIDEVQIRQTLTNENVSLEVLLEKFSSHCEHLNRIATSPSRLAMAGIDDRSKTAATDIAAMKESSEKIQQLSKLVIQRSQDYRTIFEKCVQIVEMCDFFAHECYEIMKRLNLLEQDFRQHADGYRSLFDKLIQFSTFYDQFFISFGEMVGEINRRRAEIERQNQLIKKCQQELELGYQNEKDSRERFNRLWGHCLPAGICPELKEALVRPVIIPKEIDSQLPDLSIGVSIFTSRTRSVSMSNSGEPRSS